MACKSPRRRNIPEPITTKRFGSSEHPRRRNISRNPQRRNVTFLCLPHDDETIRKCFAVVGFGPRISATFRRRGCRPKTPRRRNVSKTHDGETFHPQNPHRRNVLQKTSKRPIWRRILPDRPKKRFAVVGVGGKTFRRRGSLDLDSPPTNYVESSWGSSWVGKTFSRHGSYPPRRNVWPVTPTTTKRFVHVFVIGPLDLDPPPPPDTHMVHVAPNLQKRFVVVGAEITPTTTKRWGETHKDETMAYLALIARKTFRRRGVENANVSSSC